MVTVSTLQRVIACRETLEIPTRPYYYDTQLIAGQAEVLVFVDRRQPVASPSAKMDRGIIPRKTNPICVQSIAHVILPKIGKRSMVACKLIHDRYVKSTLESINKPIISRGKALRNRAETI